MRYPDRSGGLSAPERDRREALRFRAADMFAGKIPPPRVARLLGVTRKSVYEWHALWKHGGTAALASKGAAGSGCKLTEERLDRLEVFLEQGARAHGWDEQRWTSARVAVLIAARFHRTYTPRGVAYLLQRLGWSFQVPAHRAARRDEEIVTWIDAQDDWLLVYRLPPYAPDLNPAEGIWSNLRTRLLNFTVNGIDQLTALIRSRLKPLQYRPDLLDGFIAETGLVLSDPA
ncbi:winged helix-turn-helix domain-containing protein [Planomonospora venezuelensis]|uniref:Transposase n=1 Tax=Planomonospora venezuelensis TaxID=1999 RepID=A0A841D7J9_PLAVE|nr:winged helix-turn-helix domain-containing protein [Planomonospora venezuelensis]MBB5964464.1 transposase [Planomonospora venezuelensis]GIN04199.1 hypothetical protein Pve01_58570 [Planomonospora venezuelensis]